MRKYLTVSISIIRIRRSISKDVISLSTVFILDVSRDAISTDLHRHFESNCLWKTGPFRAVYIDVENVRVS